MKKHKINKNYHKLNSKIHSEKKLAEVTRDFGYLACSNAKPKKRYKIVSF